jgi:hypothetical protein
MAGGHLSISSTIHARVSSFGSCSMRSTNSFARAEVRDDHAVAAGEGFHLALEEPAAHRPSVQEQERLPRPLVQIAQLGTVEGHSGHQSPSPVGSPVGVGP